MISQFDARMFIFHDEERIYVFFQEDDLIYVFGPSHNKQ